MSNRYLVTEGTRFIGAALVKQFLHLGDVVRALFINSRGVLAQLGDIVANLESCEADIRNGEALNSSAGIESVTHLAYVNGTEFFCSKLELVLDNAGSR